MRQSFIPSKQAIKRQKAYMFSISYLTTTMKADGMQTFSSAINATSKDRLYKTKRKVKDFSLCYFLILFSPCFICVLVKTILNTSIDYRKLASRLFDDSRPLNSDWSQYHAFLWASPSVTRVLLTVIYLKLQPYAFLRLLLWELL